MKNKVNVIKTESTEILTLPDNRYTAIKTVESPTFSFGTTTSYEVYPKVDVPNKKSRNKANYKSDISNLHEKA
jgi:hypothetical protein